MEYRSYLITYSSSVSAFICCSLPREKGQDAFSFLSTDIILTFGISSRARPVVGTPLHLFFHLCFSSAPHCQLELQYLPCPHQTVISWPTSWTSILMQSLPLKSWPTDENRTASISELKNIWEGWSGIPGNWNEVLELKLLALGRHVCLFVTVIPSLIYGKEATWNGITWGKPCQFFLEKPAVDFSGGMNIYFIKRSRTHPEAGWNKSTSSCNFCDYLFNLEVRMWKYHLDLCRWPYLDVFIFFTFCINILPTICTNPNWSSYAHYLLQEVYITGGRSLESFLKLVASDFLGLSPVLV